MALTHHHWDMATGLWRMRLIFAQQNGKQGEPKNLLTVNEAAFKEAAGKEAQ